MFDDPKKRTPNQPDDQSQDIPYDPDDTMTGEKGGVSESQDVIIDEEIAFTPDFDDAIDLDSINEDLEEDIDLKDLEDEMA